MNNLVKLVQASGKALVVPAAAIQQGIIRTLEAQEKAKHEKAECFIWLVLDGATQTALIRERLGFILNKAGGASTERVVLDGPGNTRISMPRASFSHAIEGERLLDADGRVVSPERAATMKRLGEKVEEQDVTIVHTHLRSGGGPVAFYALDSAGDIYDAFSAELSEDDGATEYDDDGKPVKAATVETTPAKRRGKG